MRFVHFILILIGLLLCGCGGTFDMEHDNPSRACPRFYKYDYGGAKWSIRATLQTSRGYLVDPSADNVVDLELIDAIIERVDACLMEEFGDPIVLPEHVRSAAQCHENSFSPFTFSCPGRCLTIKVVDDWEWNCDETDQVLPLEAPQGDCVAKGLEAKEDCPCRWRAAVQGTSSLVVTPNLYLLGDVYLRYRGCQTPWESKEIERCLIPYAMDPTAMSPTLEDMSP